MSGRRDKGGGGHGESGEERWLLPYADMITLLLGLFIVLFAMSSLDAKKFDNVKRSLAQTFKGSVLEEPGGTLPGSNGVMNPTSTSEAPTEVAIQRLQAAQAAQAARQEQQAKDVKEVAREAGLANDVKVTNNQRGIVVSLAGDALFESGSYALKPSVKDKLTRLERQLARLGRDIEIAGHTDGAPIAGGNRRLGMERALAVYDLFSSLGFPDARMEVVSLGETDPIVKPPKGNPTKSIAKNRRIEITILAPGAKDPRDEAIKLADAARDPAFAGSSGIPGELQEEFDIVEELARTSKGLQ